MVGKIITLTGVSGSGKTTLQETLIKKFGFRRPVNWTTRKPRRSNAFNTGSSGDYVSIELDEYIYCTREQFVKKIENGDFMEYTYYNGNYYGMTGPIDRKSNYCIIVEPVGLAAYKKYFALNGYEFTSFFLDISEELQEERLQERRESINSILERKKDFNYMNRYEYDVILDGEEDPRMNILNILNEVGLDIKCIETKHRKNGRKNKQI